MEKIPYGRYTQESPEEAARLVLEDGLTAGEAVQRLSLPKGTFENLSGMFNFFEIGWGQHIKIPDSIRYVEEPNFSCTILDQ